MIAFGMDGAKPHDADLVVSIRDGMADFESQGLISEMVLSNGVSFGSINWGAP